MRGTLPHDRIRAALAASGPIAYAADDPADSSENGSILAETGRRMYSRGKCARGNRELPGAPRVACCKLIYGVLGPLPDHSPDDLAAREDGQGRDEHDPVFLRRRRILIDVELDHVHLAGVLLGDHLGHRADLAARARTPGPHGAAGPGAARAP